MAGAGTDQPVDWTVHPNTPISRLPRLLRYPALLLRNLLSILRLLPKPAPAPAGDPPGPEYVYEADGLATVYFSPFLADAEWSREYEEMARDWYPDRPGLDIRWRMWILTTVACQVRDLPGDIAEFGVYRAGCARMILGTVGLAAGTRYHLFDTFAGIPDAELTERERAEGYAGRLTDTSVAQVEQRLGLWRDALVFHVGDVFETIPEADTGDLSLVHMDLNASAPTRVALEHSYPRVVAGGAIVFDDYGWNPASFEQRDVVDEFCRPLPECLIALPSGQALLTKLP
jgi:O-methyltransferase